MMTIDTNMFLAILIGLSGFIALAVLLYTAVYHTWRPLRIACVIIGILLIALIASIRIN